MRVYGLRVFTHREVHKAFRAFDKDNDRSLSKQEFKRLLKSINAFVSRITPLTNPHTSVRIHAYAHTHTRAPSDN